MDEREALNSMLKTRFRYYCYYANSQVENARERKNALADKLADDLTNHEWETLQPRIAKDTESY